MAQPTNTYATNDMVGVREDLADVIYDISPIETPFMSMIPRVKASNTTHEWQTDSLAAAAANAQIEGDDAVAGASTPTVRLTNICQISNKVAQVTGTARAVNTAGRSDEMDYQMVKRGRELRRDMETVLLTNQAKSAGSDIAARTLAGVPSWIATNVSIGTGAAANPTGDGSDTRTDGTTRAFAESQVKEAHRECFDSGGMPDVLMVGAFNRQQASSFTGGATALRQVKDRQLVATVDVYVGDFGDLKIVPNRFQRSRDAYLLQIDMWALAFLPGREFLAEDLAKTGDSESKMITSEYTLECRNEAANGGVFDLTTS